MIKLTKTEVDEIVKIALSKIDEKYCDGVNCFSFVKNIYKEAGLILDFSDQPLLKFKDLRLQRSIGYVCFLKHKKYGYDARISHSGIIVSDTQIVHYAKYFKKPKGYKVYLATFEEIFEVYDFVEPLPDILTSV